MTTPTSEPESDALKRKLIRIIKKDLGTNHLEPDERKNAHVALKSVLSLLDGPVSAVRTQVSQALIVANQKKNLESKCQVLAMTAAKFGNDVVCYVDKLEFLFKCNGLLWFHGLCEYCDDCDDGCHDGDYEDTLSINNGVNNIYHHSIENSTEIDHEDGKVYIEPDLGRSLRLSISKVDHKSICESKEDFAEWVMRVHQIFYNVHGRISFGEHTYNKCFMEKLFKDCLEDYFSNNY